MDVKTRESLLAASILFDMGFSKKGFFCILRVSFIDDYQAKMIVIAFDQIGQHQPL